MNIFSNLTQYAGKWELSDSRTFTKEEIDSVDSAVVVASQYGNSVCFFMKGGGQTYIPMSSDSQLGVGQVVNLEEAKILTLSKRGESDITRIKI